MICPKKSEYSKVIKSREILNGNMKITQDTKSIIKNLFISLIDADINTEAKKKRLTSISGFSNYESYEIIKGKFKSFILKDDVSEYFIYKIKKIFNSYSFS
jgi:hypothetical protein